MRPHAYKRERAHRTQFAMIAIAALCIGGTAVGAEKPKVADRADQLLRQMSDFLASQQQLAVTTEGTLEFVTPEGQKLAIESTSRLGVARPNRLRVERKGQFAEGDVYYDGKHLTVYVKGRNLYAVTRAPPDLDSTIDVISERLGIHPPAADLLVSNPYKALTEDARSGEYLGRTVVNGVPAHHLAFRNNEVDWQIWISEGARPLPLKYVITSRDEPKAPQFAVELRDWDLSPNLKADAFCFRPPKGAQKVPFLAAERERRAEVRP